MKSVDAAQWTVLDRKIELCTKLSDSLLSFGEIRENTPNPNEGVI